MTDLAANALPPLPQAGEGARNGGDSRVSAEEGLQSPNALSRIALGFPPRDPPSPASGRGEACVVQRFNEDR
jgi:hypothetical protein